MRMKPFLGGLLLCLAVQTPIHAQQIDLRVDATPSIFADMFLDLKASFESRNPDIKISLDTSQRDQSDMIQRTLRQAIVNQLPDVSFQGFNYLRALSQAGHVVALDDLIAKDPQWKAEAYSPSVTAVGRLEGGVYGLGVAFSFPILFYHAGLVSEAQGGNSQLPGTWDEILELAARIQEKNPSVLGAYTRYNSFLFQGHVMSGGGSLGNAEGTEVRFTDEKGMEALRRIARFGELGQAGADMTDSQARQSFAGGRIGVLVDSSSSLENFQKQSEGRFEVATAPLPLNPENGRLPTSGIAVVLHTSDSLRREAAWKFMRFVTGPEGQTIVGRKTGYVPANEVPVRTPSLLGDYYAKSPAMNAALKSIGHAASWYEFAGPNAPRINELFATELQQLVTLKRTPEDMAQSLEKEIGRLIGN